MTRFAVFFALIVTFPIDSLALNSKIKDLVSRQEEWLRKLSNQHTWKQRELLFSRYVDLLLVSPFTLNMNVDRQEFLDYLEDAFPEERENINSPVAKRKPRFADKVEKSLASLVDTMKGRFNGELLELKFACNDQVYEFPFEVWQRQNTFGLVINGANIPDSEDDWDEQHHCLELIIDNDHSLVRVNELSTQQSACPIPEKKAGDCLLALSEKIARTLASPVMTLIDGSKVRCTRSRTFTDFKRLRVYRDGKTWYEQRGFTSASKTYPTWVESIRTYPLSKLLADMKSNSVQTDIADQTQKIAEQYLESKHKDNVAAFMTWLWEKDCALYTGVDKYINQASSNLDFARIPAGPNMFEKHLSK